MLGENIRDIRKQKGMTQEELANRIGVVRQTVSKWEKNLSVPDADLLQRIAQVLEVPVSALLGAKIEIEDHSNDLAVQLSRINEQLSIKNTRAKRIWKAVGFVLIAYVLIYLILFALNVVDFNSVWEEHTTIEMVEDGK